MVSIAISENKVIWREPLRVWLALAVGLGLVALPFWDGLVYMATTWSSREEYSYGPLIPVVSLFLVWQRKDELEKMTFDGSWAGVALIVFGLVLYMFGELATLYVLIQYAFVIVVAGIALARAGMAGFKKLLIPLLILAFMIPLPNFLLANISGSLQLISSQLGVWVIKLFGISVYLQGNVIDLGVMKLQVVEACSGLRYLFPLMTFGFLAAYFYKGVLWQRAVLFLSTIPITVLMNSFRIGVIGVTVEFWGQDMAQGFLHDFEGWVIFMASAAVLLGEMWIFARFSTHRKKLLEVFGVELPAKSPAGAEIRYRMMPKPFLSALAIVLTGGILFLLLPRHAETIPLRATFTDFPKQVGDWSGERDRLDVVFIDALKFDDYILVNFKKNNLPLTFYAAYYQSQKKGQSAHSPRSCIPGGGWQIASLDTVELQKGLRANRAIVRQGEKTQLVYYWFKQRDRIVTNEYMVKWYIFWDALWRNRTDGALVRLSAPVLQGQSVEEVEQHIREFATGVTPLLTRFVPD